MAKITAFEQTLVSMVSSLVHLRTIGEELSKKPFVIPRLAAIMAGSSVEFESLTTQFDRTEEALQVEAKPYLDAWLAAMRISVDSELRLEGGNSDKQARVRGRLSEARLHCRIIGGRRCIELRLDDIEFSDSVSGPFRPKTSFKDADLAPVIGWGRAQLWPERDGKPAYVLVVLPIKLADVDELSKGPHYYFRLV